MAFALSPFDTPEASASDAAGPTGGRGPVQVPGRLFLHRDPQRFQRLSQGAAERAASNINHAIEVSDG